MTFQASTCTCEKPLLFFFFFLLKPALDMGWVFHFLAVTQRTGQSYCLMTVGVTGCS